MIPSLGLGLSLLGLVLDAFLAGDSRRHGLSQLDQIGLHVRHRLLEDLGGVLSTADQIVQIGTEQTANAIEQPHGPTAGTAQ